MELLQNGQSEDINIFENFGGNLGIESRLKVQKRIKDKAKTVIICLEGWLDLDTSTINPDLCYTLLIHIDSHKKYYECKRKTSEFVRSEYEAPNKMVFTLEFEPLPDDIKEFKIVRIGCFRKFFGFRNPMKEIIYKDVLCYVRRNKEDIYSLKTADSIYVNTTLYGGDIYKKGSLAWYINKKWRGEEAISHDPIMNMTIDNWRSNPSWRFSLERFHFAQERYFEKAFDEIQVFHRKLSHWMWFIFPQVEYLGISDMSKFYSLSYTLTKDYLNNQYLMNNMYKILNLLMCIENRNVVQIFGQLDSEKFMSSLTLFHFMSLHKFGSDNIFVLALRKFFSNRYCGFTQKYLEMCIESEELDDIYCVKEKSRNNSFGF